MRRWAWRRAASHGCSRQAPPRLPSPALRTLARRALASLLPPRVHSRQFRLAACAAPPPPPRLRRRAAGGLGLSARPRALRPQPRLRRQAPRAARGAIAPRSRTTPVPPRLRLRAASTSPRLFARPMLPTPPPQGTTPPPLLATSYKGGDRCDGVLPDETARRRNQQAWLAWTDQTGAAPRLGGARPPAARRTPHSLSYGRAISPRPRHELAQPRSQLARTSLAGARTNVMPAIGFEFAWRTCSPLSPSLYS